MARFDKPHQPSDPSGDSLDHRLDQSAQASGNQADVLRTALQDVSVPEGLEARLLAAVHAGNSEANVVASDLLEDAGETNNVSQTSKWSRRRVLSAGLAAGLGSIFAGGMYARSRRPLAVADVCEAVIKSLGKIDWVAWTPLPDSRVAVTIPRRLRKPREWQMRKTAFSSSVVAFNMSLPGCPKSVLFAAKTPRDLSAFAKAPPAAPQFFRTGVWSHIAVWQDPNLSELYVLAIQSDRFSIKRDYSRLFRTSPAAQLA